MNNSSNNAKRKTGIISETSSVPFLLSLTLSTDVTFLFLKTGGGFLGTKQETFFY